MGLLLCLWVNGFPWWLSCKESASQCRRQKFDPWIRKIPWRRNRQPTPVFLPGKSHGQSGLVGHSPWDYKSQSWFSNQPTTSTGWTVPTLWLTTSKPRFVWQKALILQVNQEEWSQVETLLLPSLGRGFSMDTQYFENFLLSVNTEFWNMTPQCCKVSILS